MNRRNARVQKDGTDFEGWGGVRRMSYPPMHPHHTSTQEHLYFQILKSGLIEALNCVSESFRSLSIRYIPPCLSYSFKTL